MVAAAGAIARPQVTTTTKTAAGMPSRSRSLSMSHIAAAAGSAAGGPSSFKRSILDPNSKPFAPRRGESGALTSAAVASNSSTATSSIEPFNGENKAALVDRATKSSLPAQELSSDSISSSDDLSLAGRKDSSLDSGCHVASSAEETGGSSGPPVACDVIGNGSVGSDDVMDIKALVELKMKTEVEKFEEDRLGPIQLPSQLPPPLPPSKLSQPPTSSPTMPMTSGSSSSSSTVFGSATSSVSGVGGGGNPGIPGIAKPSFSSIGSSVGGGCSNNSSSSVGGGGSSDSAFQAENDAVFLPNGYQAINVRPPAPFQQQQQQSGNQPPPQLPNPAAAAAVGLLPTPVDFPPFGPPAQPPTTTTNIDGTSPASAVVTSASPPNKTDDVTGTFCDVINATGGGGGADDQFGMRFLVEAIGQTAKVMDPDKKSAFALEELAFATGSGGEGQQPEVGASADQNSGGGGLRDLARRNLVASNFQVQTPTVLNDSVPAPIQEYLHGYHTAKKLPDADLRHAPSDLLFFLFYIGVEDKVQLSTAIELFRRGWRYHKRLKIWLGCSNVAPMQRSRVSERGKYQFFNVQNWNREEIELTIYYEDVAGMDLTGISGTGTNNNGSGGSGGGRPSPPTTCHQQQQLLNEQERAAFLMYQQQQQQQQIQQQQLKLAKIRAAEEMQARLREQEIREQAEAAAEQVYNQFMAMNAASLPACAPPPPPQLQMPPPLPPPPPQLQAEDLAADQ